MYEINCGNHFESWHIVRKKLPALEFQIVDIIMRYVLNALATEWLNLLRFKIRIRNKLRHIETIKCLNVVRCNSCNVLCLSVCFCLNLQIVEMMQEYIGKSGSQSNRSEFRDFQERLVNHNNVWLSKRFHVAIMHYYCIKLCRCRLEVPWPIVVKQIHCCFVWKYLNPHQRRDVIARVWL